MIRGSRVSDLEVQQSSKVGRLLRGKTWGLKAQQGLKALLSYLTQYLLLVTGEQQSPEGFLSFFFFS